MHNITHHKWEYFTETKDETIKLAKKLNVDPKIIHIVANRGLVEEAEIKPFLNPTLRSIIKEFCPKEVEKGIQRVSKAIKNKEKVVVFGDYDADGVTGTVVLLDGLKRLGVQASYYVPYRYTEGYGLNKDAIRNFQKDGVNLIVTVDCGVSNYEEIKLANELGIDVLVTDHHTPPAKLPPAVAVINPKCEHNDLSRNLAGVGVAYKFVYQLYQALKKSDIMKNKKYLELVAIGTITDVVPLVGDNRVFVKKGIEKLNRETSLGLFYLIDQLSNHYVDTTTIGYGIGPRLNAAGRLASAGVGIELLITKDKQTAKNLALELNELNERRKREGEKIFHEALKIIEANPAMLEKKVIVLSSNEWEPGVVGIVASQLGKHYERPVVLITTRGNISRGSIRSFAGMNVFTSLEECKDLLLNYGGHPEAAGFEIDEKNIAEFSEKYIKRLGNHLKEEDLFSVIKIDLELDIQEISFSLLSSLSLLEPFGEGNREPIFLTKALNAINYECVGRERNHLKVLFISGSHQIEAIGYKMGHYYDLLNQYTTFDVVYNLTENNYGGRKKLQLKLIDLKPSNLE